MTLGQGHLHSHHQGPAPLFSPGRTGHALRIGEAEEVQDQLSLPVSLRPALPPAAGGKGKGDGVFPLPMPLHGR